MSIDYHTPLRLLAPIDENDPNAAVSVGFMEEHAGGKFGQAELVPAGEYPTMEALARARGPGIYQVNSFDAYTDYPIDTPSATATGVLEVLKWETGNFYRLRLSRNGGEVWTRYLGTTNTSWTRVLDGTLYAARTVTVDIEDLQATINSLPKYLDRNTTINVREGEITTAITINGFVGPGTLAVVGATAARNYTRKVLRLTVSDCALPILTVQGITATATTGNCFHINRCMAGSWVYLYMCNAIEGTPISSFYGVYMQETASCYVSTCEFSGKSVAIWARSGRMRVSTTYGEGNNTVYYSSHGAVMQLSAVGTITGATMYLPAAGSAIYTADGDIITVNRQNLAPATERYKYSSTSGTLGVIIKTDQTGAAGFWQIKLRANMYTGRVALDTDISFWMTAGAVTQTTMTMLNKALPISNFSVFKDTDDTWSIYVPFGYRYSALYAEAYVNTNSSTYSSLAQINRVTSILNRVEATVPKPEDYSYFITSTAGTYNYGTVTGRTRTTFVSTQIGTNRFGTGGDNWRRGENRTNSVQTIAAALNLYGHSNRADITINRYRTAAPAAYAAATVYELDAMASSGGFVWRRRTAGSGTTPSITAAPWEFVKDEQNDGTPYPLFEDDTNYALGNIVRYPGTGTNADELTYVCIVAITGNHGPHTRPTGTLLPNRNWAACGAFNPVISGTQTISYLSSLNLGQTEALDVIFTGSVTLTDNKAISNGIRMRVGATLTLNYNAVYYDSAIISANLITAAYCGSLRFNTTVDRITYASFTSCSQVTFAGAVTVNTEIPTRVGVLVAGSNVQFNNTLTMNGNNVGNSSTTLPAANTARALSVTTGGNLLLLGNTTGAVTIDGFGTAIGVETGGTVDCRARTLTMRKGANTSDNDTVAIMVGPNGQFIGSRNTLTYTRTDCADAIDATYGTVLDYKKLYEADLLGFN